MQEGARSANRFPDRECAQIAWYLYRIALDEQQRGHLDESIAASDETIAAFAQVPRDQKNGAITDSRLALALTTRGETLRNKGDIRRAYDSSSEAIAVVERRRALGDSESLRRNLAWSYMWRAMCAGRGDLSQALTDARASLALREGLVAGHSDDVFLAYEEVLSSFHVAEVQARVVQDDDVVGLFKTVLSRLEPVLKREPDNAEWQVLRADAQALLCRQEIELSRVADAQIDCKRALDLRTKIAQLMHDKSGTRIDVADATESLAEALVLAGHAPDAVASLETASAGSPGWEPFALGASNITLPRRHLLLGLARAHLGLSQPREALDAALGARSAWESAVRVLVSNAFAMDSLSEADLLVGDSYVALGDRESARAAYAGAHDRCADLRTLDPADVVVTIHCVEAAAKLSSLTSEAAAVRELREEAQSLGSAVPASRLAASRTKQWLNGGRR